MEKQVGTELNFSENEHFSRPPEGGEIMAVFRIEKTRDYTVMANHHLRNTALSLKAKGLLSLMLSLPEDWDYTTKGLARICRDGVDSIPRRTVTSWPLSRSRPTA